MLSKTILDFIQKRIVIVGSIVGLSLLAQLAFCAPQADSSGVIAATKQLQIERERNLVANDRLSELEKDKQRQWQHLKPDEIDQLDINRADLDIATAQADLSAINLTHDDIKQSIESIQRNIQELENQSQNANIGVASIENSNNQRAELQFRLSQQRTALKLQQARLKNLLHTQAIAKKRLEIQQEWRNKLQSLLQAFQYEKRKHLLENTELSVQRDQQRWLERLAVLNQQMKALEEQSLTETPAYARLALWIFEADERSNLSHLELVTARLNNQLQDLATDIQGARSITDWNTAKGNIDGLINNLVKSQELLQGKVGLIKQHEQIGSKGKASGIIDAKELQANLRLLEDLADSYQQQLIMINKLMVTANQYQDIINVNLRKALARRQGLPGFNLEEWITLGQKIAQIPPLVVQTLKAAQQQIVTGLSSLGTWKQAGLALVLLLWAGLLRWFKPHLQRLVAYYHDHIHGAAANSIFIILELIRRNLYGLGAVCGISLLFFVADVSNKFFTLLIAFSIVWFSFKSVNELIKLSIFETMADKAKRDVKFYRRLKYLVITGGILTTFIILTRELPVFYEVEDFFNRIFMFFLLFISLLLFKANRLLSHLFTPYVLGAPHYVKKITRLLIILVPMLMFSTAVVGLIGYVELAWTICRYEGQFLLILTIYLILKGVVREIIERLSKSLIKNSRNGWLWSEAFLKPLDRIIKIAVFIFSAYMLVLFYNLDKNSYVIIKLNDFARLRLFSLAGGDITFMVLLELIIVLSIVIWIGKWAREFSHRWLFYRIKDVGLRNSSAVFMQYALVIIGILICLKIIGINLFALTAVASAFALGVGLGLRDLANNFAAGVLLLIERPLRKGDLVTIGGYEGEITHIGMRSITVYTSDLTEVMVPNADAFSKTFVNWTLRHSIVRGVIQLRISPHDDPHLVQQELLAIMQSTEGVISNPPPEAYFKEMNNHLLDFEIRYYINLKLTASRSEMRSKVLFAIWDRFAELGIQITPLAEQNINITSLPDNHSGYLATNEQQE